MKKLTCWLIMQYQAFKAHRKRKKESAEWSAWFAYKRLRYAINGELHQWWNTEITVPNIDNICEDFTEEWRIVFYEDYIELDGIYKGRQTTICALSNVDALQIISNLKLVKRKMFMSNTYYYKKEIVGKSYAIAY